ncbi:MAG: NUDIX domain-containing protein [Candidatus Diapherotrites archaeon]
MALDFSQFDKGVFLVNLLGIVFDEKAGKILIGRRENDPHVKELGWCFPGGRPLYEGELEESLKAEIRKKTGLEVEVKEIVFAKTYPEKREFLAIYYCCSPKGGKEQSGEKFKELKWIRPTEVTKYFTTSLHPKVLEFLKTLEEKQ